MGYNSKSIGAVQNNFSVEVDQVFLKARVKNLAKGTRIGDVMGKKRPHTLRELFFSFRH